MIQAINGQSFMKEHKISKKTIIVTSLVAATAIGLGVGGGFLIRSFIKPSQDADYNFDTAGLKDDIASIRVKYDKAKASGTPLETALSPSDMVNLGYDNFTKLSSNKAVGYGATVSAGITQVIESITVKNGARSFEESNSSGVVNLYDRMYEEGDAVTTYWGSDLNYANHTPKTYTTEEYAALMGRKVSEPTTYLISNKTIFKSEANNLSGDGISSIAKTSSGYTVEIELNPVKGVVNYVKQMVTISELAKEPVFYFCHLTFHLDEQLNLVDCKTHEKYNVVKASIPLPVDCVGTITYKYFTSGTYEIPEVGADLRAEYDIFK